MEVDDIDSANNLKSDSFLARNPLEAVSDKLAKLDIYISKESHSMNLIKSRGCPRVEPHQFLSYELNTSDNLLQHPLKLNPKESSLRP